MAIRHRLAKILSGGAEGLWSCEDYRLSNFGKALVQSVAFSERWFGLAVTIAHYYTPKGTDISQKGVTPDVKIDLNDDPAQASWH
jgi:carboxyl-terminal processing protease